MVKRLAVLALLALSCIPPVRDVHGYACDDAHPCPDNLPCVGNVCGGAAGGGAMGGGSGGMGGGAGGGGGMAGPSCSTPNEVPNGGFEQSVLGVWVVQGGGMLDQDSLVKHSGSTSARITTMFPADLSLMPTTPLDTSDVGTYCAEAWVLGLDAGQVSLNLKGSTTTSQHVTPDGTWQHLTDTFDVGQFQSLLTLSVETTLDSSGVLFVDDVCFSKCQ
jgi:hypothetical protein